MKCWPSARKSCTRTTLRVRPAVEELESRLVPYALTGNSWAHPELVTLSFVPDGTDLGGVSSNLFATFNARFGSPAVWQNAILSAAQQWAQATNLNFAVVTDSGAPIGSGPDQQGDPTIGDIRIGGFAFASSSLAMAYAPPPANNYSLAGDVAFNTSQSYHIGSTYDLFTVTMHEMGHALGMAHSTYALAAMYPYYIGARSGLSFDDVNGIRAAYNGPRAQDRFDAVGSNGSFYSATNLNAFVDPTSLTGVVTGLDITTTSDVDFYQVTAPASTTGTFTVTVQSQGLSLLAPALKVYDANLNLIGTASGAGRYGTTLTLNLNNVAPGQSYYVRVSGADGSALGTGAYALTLNFGSNPTPFVPLPNTTTPNGSPMSAGGGLAETPGFVGRISSLVGTTDHRWDKFGILGNAAGAAALLDLLNGKRDTAGPNSNLTSDPGSASTWLPGSDGSPRDAFFASGGLDLLAWAAIGGTWAGY